MIKIMTGILGLALLAAPLVGFAEKSTSAELPAAQQVPNRTKSGPPPTTRQQLDDASYCQGKSDGTTVPGVVIGLGGDWLQDNAFPFVFQTSDGKKWADQPSYTYDVDQGALMFNLLMTSYLTGVNITLTCTKNNISAVYLGNGP